MVQFFPNVVEPFLSGVGRILSLSHVNFAFTLLNINHATPTLN